METIKVNMSPNPLDVQTIHASQNDGEAREWGFALHNNGEKIDSSSISDQLVFKSYKGGTEQILPENGAVPVTAPFVGDVKYPDATRTDQEFLYRQSPTEEDGLAKITDIKGNTIVWNQLQKATASTSTINGITYTNNGDGSWTVSGTATATAQKSLTISADWITAISGHKYLTVGGLPNGGSSKWLMQLYKNNANTLVGTDSGNGLIYTADDTTINLSLYFTVYNGNTVSGKIYPQIFDLTQMFGAGNEPTSVSDFTSLFSKPYYDYCKGAMLSFGGRNVKFNQLVQNGNFVNTNGWNFNNPSSVSVSSNTLTVSANADASMGFPLSRSMASTQGHKYLIMCDVQCSQDNQVRVRYPFVSTAKSISANTWTRFTEIGTATEGHTLVGIQENGINGATYNYKNFVCFDLTEMFGAGNEPSAEGFKELFPNSYYEYNVGQYMNLGQPVGIKTVGANILDLSSEFDRAGVRYTVDEDGWFTVTNITYPNLNSNRFMLPLALTNGSALIEIDTSKTASTNFRMILYNDTIRVATTTTKLENNAFDRISFGWSTAGSTTFRVMVTTMSTIGTYEPYTSSTLSLPISTYFPTGMKSAGTVYDELTPSKAITRIGSVDLGSLTWVYYSEQNRFAVVLNNGKPSGTGFGLDGVCDKYAVSKVRYVGLPDQSLSVGTNFFSTTTCAIVVHDENYTDATTFKSAMSGVYLYYELATPTETSFTTASLVTENGEIPLSNDDGVLIGKCTEQLSENPGFIDAKIKLTDADGECYSNKLQLHVERSPQ